MRKAKMHDISPDELIIRRPRPIAKITEERRFEAFHTEQAAQAEQRLKETPDWQHDHAAWLATGGVEWPDNERPQNE